MDGKKEYMPSQNEIAEAQLNLTSEQKVGTEARFEIKKHQEILRAVGLSDEKINEAAEMASKKAVEDFHELERSDPWKITMDTLESVKPELSEAGRLLLSGHQRWSQEFVIKWKEEFDRAYIETGKDLTPLEITRRVWERTNGHAPVGGFHTAWPDKNEPHWAVLPYQFPGIDLMRSKWRGVVDENISDRNDPRYKELIFPSIEDIQKVYKGFGSTFPEKVRNSYENDPETMNSTKFEGVFLDVVKIGNSQDYSFQLIFSPDALGRMVRSPMAVGQPPVPNS